MQGTATQAEAAAGEARRHGRRARQHVGRVDPARARPGRALRPHAARRHGDARRRGRRLHLGRGAAGLLERCDRSTMTPFAFVFPGQGSQSVGMLDAGATIRPCARRSSEASDGAGRGRRPTDPRRPEGSARPHHQHPAGDADRRHRLLSRLDGRGRRAPAAVAGHSLGEYTALVAAGALTLADALPLVRFRAQAMQDAVPVGVGAMAAILGLDADAVRAGCAEAASASGESVEAVNFNDPKQTVIAGTQGRRRPRLRGSEGQGRQARAAAAGLGAVPLQPDEAGRRAAARTPGRHAARRAGHPGGQQRRRRGAGTTRRPSAMRCTARPSARCAGSRRCRRCVRAAWRASIECGPGKVLSGMVKRIDAEAAVGTVHDPASLAETRALLA